MGDAKKGTQAKGALWIDRAANALAAELKRLVGI
jgi:hypothetical protein